MFALKKNEKLDKHKQITSTLLLILVIQFSDKTISRGNRWSKEWVFIFPFLFLFFLLTIKHLSFKTKISKRNLLFIIYVSFSILISSLFNLDFNVENLSVFLVFSSAFFLSNLLSQREYLTSYNNAILFYSVYSLVSTYIILPIIMKLNVNFFPTYIGPNGLPFTDLIFAYVLRWNGVFRNQGYFTEPGVFQFYLLLAVVIEKFYLKRKNKFKIIYILTLLSTFSSAGIISFALLELITCVKTCKEKTNTKLFFSKIINVLFILLVLYLFILKFNMFYYFKYALIDKFKETSSGSFFTRYYSIKYLIISSLKRPILGLGMQNGLNTVKNFGSSFPLTDVTGGFFIYFTAYGLPFSVIVTSRLYQSIEFVVNDRVIVNVFVLCILFLSSSTQNLSNDIIFVMLFYIPFMKRSDLHQ